MFRCPKIVAPNLFWSFWVKWKAIWGKMEGRGKMEKRLLGYFTENKSHLVHKIFPIDFSFLSFSVLHFLLGLKGNKGSFTDFMVWVMHHITLISRC
jgi:hypothetical protein